MLWPNSPDVERHRKQHVKSVGKWLSREFPRWGVEEEKTECAQA